MPSVEKLAVVFSAAVFPKVTVPGPVTLDQVVVTVFGGSGSPSSLTEPDRFARSGSVIVWLAPAETVGAWLADPQVSLGWPT